EAGARLGREFLAADLVDELQLAVAPFLVGDPAAPRFAGPASYPQGPSTPLALAGTQRLDDVVVLRYLRGEPGRPGTPGVGAEASAAAGAGPRGAIGLPRRCPPSRTAFAVGAVIVAADGTLLATGYSRESDPRDHAEEVALAKLDRADPRLAGATLYSSL